MPLISRWFTSTAIRELDEIKARYPFPTLVVRTSAGRHPVYWRLKSPIEIPTQEDLMRKMAKDIGADKAATDVSRVLRLPGFWNRKVGRDVTVDIVFSRDEPIEYQSLLQAITEQNAESLSIDGFLLEVER